MPLLYGIGVVDMLRILWENYKGLKENVNPITISFFLILLLFLPHISNKKQKQKINQKYKLN